MSRTLKQPWAIYLIGVMVFTVLGWIIYLSTGEHERWEVWCAEMNGQVQKEISTYQSFEYVEGERVSQTHTKDTYFCLSDSGGIIDSRD